MVALKSNSHSDSLVFRDVGLAALIGPLRVLVPTLGYVVLYRVILDRSGLKVLGLWSLLSTVAVYMTAVDVGFSQLIAREAGRDVEMRESVETRKDYLAARRAYLVAGAVLVVLAAGAGVLIAAAVPIGIYPAVGVGFALPLIAGTAVVTLSADLDAALLSGFSDNHFVQGTAAATPLFTFVAAIVGALMRHPIEGFAIGALFAAVSQLALFRFRLRRIQRDWMQDVDLRWRDTGRRVRELARRGAFLYVVSIGFIAREPIFRFVVAAFTGFAGVGVYDIALRVTGTLRQLTATGFAALYPAFAYFHRLGAREHSVRLLRISLLLLLGGGGLTLGAILAFPNTIFYVWLHHVPPGLAISTRLLGVWQLMTIANVPFWFLLQSTGHERVAASSVWLHTASVLALLPLSFVLHMSLPALLVYWLAAAVLTQAMIYHFTHKRLGLFLPVVRNYRVLALVGIVSVFVGAIVGAPAAGFGDALGSSTERAAVLYLGLVLSIFFIVRQAAGELIALAGSHSPTGGAVPPSPASTATTQAF